MRTRLVTMAALLALLGSGFAGAQAPAPGRLAVFKAGVDVVNLAVTVTDPKGRFITDLGEGDFEVLEEGVRQPLTIFTREDLPVSAHRQFERALHLRKLALAADERGEATPRCDIEVTARRPGCHDLENIDGPGDPFDFGWPQPVQFKITFDQAPRLFADDDAVRGRNALHARRQIDHVADW